MDSGKFPILVVDDTSLVRAMVVAALRSFGFKDIDQAGDGSLALKMLETRERYGLVILDLLIPGIPGLELLKTMRSEKKLKSIPVLIISSEGDKSTVVAAGQAGANGYLIKPFSQLTLKNRLALILRNGHLGEEHSCRHAEHPGGG